MKTALISAGAALMKVIVHLIIYWNFGHWRSSMECGNVRKLRHRLPGNAGPYPKLIFLEFFLADSARRADPIVGKIFEGHARRRCGLGVIYISADKADIFFHLVFCPFLIQYPCSTNVGSKNPNHFTIYVPLLASE
jgi:hypothetical protein